MNAPRYRTSASWFKAGLDYQKAGVNLVKAFSCYKISAEKGFVFGMYHLARCYQVGIGTEKNLAAAFKWMRQAADKKYAEAEFQTALLGLQNSAAQKTEALVYLGRAAKQNHPTAQRLLADCYLNGVIGAVNIECAFEWYALSAKAGDRIAQYNLACMYQRAHGVAQNFQPACFWFERAAKQGYQPAFNALLQLEKNKLNPQARQSLARLKFMKKVL